jgi:hypothetical protein
MFETPGDILGVALRDIVGRGAPRSPQEIRAGILENTFEGVEAAVQKHLLDRSKYTYAYVVPKGTEVK